MKLFQNKFIFIFLFFLFFQTISFNVSAQKEKKQSHASIQTNVAILKGLRKTREDYMMVDMGEPKFGWSDIPLAMPLEDAAAAVTAFSGQVSPHFRVGRITLELEFLQDDVAESAFFVLSLQVLKLLLIWIAE